MARRKARFRISLKGNFTGQALKIELLPWIGSRYSVRQNGYAASQISEASLSVGCARLRRWLVRQAKAAYRQH